MLTCSRVKMGYVTHCFAFFVGVGYCFGSLCPKNSAIQQEHGHRIWCVWIVNRMLNEKSLAVECQRSEGNIYIVEDETVQQYLVDTLGPKLLKKNLFGPIWIKGTANYSNWDMSSANTGNCVTASQPLFQWMKSSCGAQHHGICYKELNCPNDGTYILTGDLCYWIPSKTPLVIRNAELRCNMNNGTLAVIPGQTVLDALSTNELFISVENLWLGLSDVDEEGVFKTQDDVPAPFLKWNQGNPDDFLYPDTMYDCVILQQENSQFYMNDVSCGMEAVPLCFIAIYSMETIPSPTTPAQLSTTNTKPVLKAPTELWITSEPDVPATTTHAQSDSPCPSTGKQEICSCVKKACNMEYLNSSDALTKQLGKLKSENHIDFKNTSAYLRSLVCATDDRPSSQCIGLAAAVILITIVSLIVLPDTVMLLRVLASSHR